MHLYIHDSIVVIVKVNLDFRKSHIKYNLCMATRDPALTTLLLCWRLRGRLQTKGYRLSGHLQITHQVSSVHGHNR